MTSDYFEVPQFGWWMLIIGGLSLNWVIAYEGEVFPYDYVPAVGPGLKYLGDNHSLLLQRVFIGALMVHVLEGAIGYFLARRKKLTQRSAIKWCLQSLVLGFPSLLILRRYNPNIKPM